jgi:hypothetical protein
MALRAGSNIGEAAEEDLLGTSHLTAAITIGAPARLAA